MLKFANACLLVILLGLNVGSVYAQDSPKKPGGGPPPMLVEVENIQEGDAEPLTSFVGTVFFARSANIAAEIEGIVQQVLVEDGESVRKKTPLVVLDDDLLTTEIDGTRAAYEQNEVDVSQARRDFERIANLFKEDSIAETEYESYQTTLRRFEKLSIVLKARLDKLLLEQQKKTIRAPFDGVVIETLAEEGEWVPEGGAVALLADNRSLEVQVDIPAEIIGFLNQGRTVSITVNGSVLDGTFLTVIPKGDIATRTFSAKFKVVEAPKLVEGMEARVELPIGPASNSLLVPRDAVVDSFGKKVVYVVEDNQVRMVSVKVKGTTSQQVAISGDGLEVGQPVVTKGNERIRDGQTVRVGK
ncbi:MAG: efflux RND transporter periplasmic adaptor subunit [Deltaproteobacteria bacterium]|jgi:RND family efflux transporter MFP subunit|nr:efflux RND transporter periplasmic adaptor subunit [Deltaproteobacteria bacterium]